MDVLTIILACSVYPDDSVVRAMVDLASQGNRYFVGDLTTLLTFDHNQSAVDAKRVVTEIDKRGGRPAVGLMGLPPSWAERPVDLPGPGGPVAASADLFDACTNVRVGTTVLRAHYDACTVSHSATTLATPVDPSRVRTAPPEALRLCALRRYAADLGVEGFGDAVVRHLPRQRVFGSVDLFAPGGATANACLCEEPVRRRRAPPAPASGSPSAPAPSPAVTRTRERERAPARVAETPPGDTGATRLMNPSSSPILE